MPADDPAPIGGRAQPAGPGNNLALWAGRRTRHPWRQNKTAGRTANGADQMRDTKQPLIHKAPVHGLRVHVGRAGLSIGDGADLARLPEGGIGIFATVRHPFLGLIPIRRRACIGHLGPVAEALVAPSVDEGDPLRVRIVGVNPEHLAREAPPEVHISVWGDPRHLTPPPPPMRGARPG